MIAAAMMLASTMTAGNALQPVQGGYPKVEAYRLCGVRNAARLDRDRPKDAPEVLARNATLQCDALLGPAVEETLDKAGLKAGGAQAMADFRQRSIADLAHKITTRRASQK